MKIKNYILLFMILTFLVTQVGCGKKAPPVPPLNDKPDNST
jgi:predicted small lipoprotein YifL